MGRNPMYPVFEWIGTLFETQLPSVVADDCSFPCQYPGDGEPDEATSPRG